MTVFNIYEHSIKLPKEPDFGAVCYRVNDVLNQLRKDHIIDKVVNLKYYMSPITSNIDIIEDTKIYTFVMFDTASNDYIDITCNYYNMQGLLDIRMDYYKVEEKDG